MADEMLTFSATLWVLNSFPNIETTEMRITYEVGSKSDAN